MSASASSLKTAMNKPSISIEDFIAALPCLVQWRNSKGRMMPLHYESAPGMGKTTVPEQAVRFLAMANPGRPVGLAVHNLGILTPTDLPGYTLFDTIQTPTGPEKVSIFTRPTVFAVNRAIIYSPGHEAADDAGFVEETKDDLGQPLYVGSLVHGQALTMGLTLLDEYMQADAEVRKVSAPLLDEGRVATHNLPMDWGVWAASNRAKDASGVGRALAFLTNRWASFEVTLTVDMSEAYLSGESVFDRIEPISPTMVPELDRRGRIKRNPKDVDSKAHPAVLAYMRMAEDILYAGVPSDPGMPYLTPRSLEAASNLFDVMVRLGVADDTGAMAADASFVDSFISRRDSGKIEGITGSTTDRWRVFQAMLAGTIGSENANDMLSTLELFDEIPTLAEMIKEPAKAHVSQKKDAQFLASYQISNGMTKKTAEPLMAYAKRLSPALYQNILHNATARDGEILTAPCVADWMMRNPDSMLRMMTMRMRAMPAGRKIGG